MIKDMNAKEFFDLVVKMREKQKEFFRTHDKIILQQSKDIEKLVDAEIKRVQRLTIEPELNFD